MPGYKRLFTKKNIRKYRRKSKRYSKKAQIGQVKANYLKYYGNTNTLLPQTFDTKCVLANMGYIASGVASGHYTVKLNSVWEPMDTASPFPNVNIAVNNMSPAGLENLLNANAGVYQFSKVIGCKIYITLNPESDNIIATITPSVQVAEPSTVAIAMNQPLNSYRSIDPTIGDMKTNAMKRYFDIAYNLFGQSKNVYLNQIVDTFGAQTGTDPTNLIYWIINWRTGDGSVLSGDVHYTIHLTYYVRLTYNLFAELAN